MTIGTKESMIFMNDNLTKTRTSATVTSTKLAIFKTVAGLKYDTDPMNSAWEESVDLFLKANKEQLKKINIEIEDILEK